MPETSQRIMYQDGTHTAHSLYLRKQNSACPGTLAAVTRSLHWAVHLALILGWSVSFAMKRTKQKVGVWAIVFGLVALSFSACTSAPAPVVYANRAPPPAIRPQVRPPVPLDLTTIPFDADTAPRILYDQPASECVPYARAISGIEIRGDAVTWWRRAEGLYVRSHHPAESAVLVLQGYSDNTRGHVAVVRAVVSERLIRVDHANWLKGGEVSVSVPVIDVSPDNDWSEVRVWHIPGGYWGGRTYQVQGFILPVGLVAGASTTG